MVFYFTATGNSLYAAKKFSEEPVSIPQVLRGSRRHFSDSAIGVVFPDYSAEPPRMVKKFLRECTFDTPYFYMILTYGHDISDAPEFTAKLAREEWGLNIDYIAPVLMVDNFLPVFDVSEEAAMEKHEDEQLGAALQDVLARRRYIPEGTEEGRELHRRVAKMQKLAGVLPVSPLKIEKTCNGCGLCANVCPARNITTEGGRAKHGGSCEFCLACANLCPRKAVRPRMADKNPNARYRTPGITLDEIIRANGPDPC